MGIDARIYVATDRTIDLQLLSWKLGTVFGHDNFWYQTWGSGGDPNKALAVEYLQGPIEQDGPDLEPPQGKTWIEVYVSTRFYGEGYERGNFMLIYGICRFLELEIPDAEVFYGGDSSGICATRFDAAARDKLLTYYLTQGHAKSIYLPLATVVLKCPRCNQVMHNVGGGGSRDFYSCSGCPNRAVHDRTSKKTKWLERDEEFFNTTP